MQDPRVIIALDFPDQQPALDLVSHLHPDQCRLKVGKEMFTRYGPAFVEQLTAAGFSVFLDLKFHDIPNTVAGACRAAADLGVWMVNVHASGGRRMLEAARDSLASQTNPPLLIGVTVLTSLADEELRETGLRDTAEVQVLRLATLAQSCGLDGVVCSAREVAPLRAQLSADFKLVTPGIRPLDSDAADQRRVMTPVDAIKAGSDYLVIGRPITQAADPAGKLLTINSEIADALGH